MSVEVKDIKTKEDFLMVSLIIGLLKKNGITKFRLTDKEVRDMADELENKGIMIEMGKSDFSVGVSLQDESKEIALERLKNTAKKVVEQDSSKKDVVDELMRLLEKIKE